ncbi:luciferase family protein [Streptomyces sp. NPDC006458]|uniref:three-helix bundle dimerization domain-containing protein n=1 Tax=Streptomyces sp. NPDC006458 TaxID=3154302 RepID=UPI0033B7B775
MTTASRALTQLASWPDLTQAPPSCGTGRALRSDRAEIAHFHSEMQVDLHLTARMIHHFESDLRDSSAIHLVPGSHWVTIRMECQADIDLLMTLVSAALHAHQGRPDHGGALHAPCNDHDGPAPTHENTGGPADPPEQESTVAVDEREEEAIRALIERLTASYSPTRSPAEIEAAVTAAHASFKDRPIRDFVPVLVERKVRAAFGRTTPDR